MKPDVELPKPPEENGGGNQSDPALLKNKEPEVTDIRKGRVGALILVAALILGVSIGLALSSRKDDSVQAAGTREPADAAGNNQSPKPPAALATLDKHDGIHQPFRDRNAQQQGGQPASGASAPASTTENSAGGDQGGFAAKWGIPAPTQDQRTKDRLSANRAPVAFEGKDLRPQDPAPVQDVSQPPPALGGLNQVVDRLSGLGAVPEADDQNRQGEKRGFVKENRDDFPYLKAPLLAPLSKYEVKAGSIIPGVLLTGINSDLPGQITAQVRENVYDTVSGRYLLIPQGTRLIGEYDSKVAYGQERVLVVWTRLIMPNGNSVGLEGMPGVDLSGYAGVGGRVNNHYGKLITGVVLGSVIGAGAQVAVGGQGAPNTPSSFGQLFVAGAAGNINQAGQQITQKNLNLQPTIEVPPGQKINIFLTKDLILRPYSE